MSSNIKKGGFMGAVMDMNKFGRNKVNEDSDIMGTTPSTIL